MQSAEGFGNYIYIVFAVLYIIYSIVKAAKKVNKNRPATSPPKEQSRTSPSPEGHGSYTAQKKEEKFHPIQPTVKSGQAPEAKPLPEKEDDFKKILEDLLGEVPEIQIPEKQIPKPKPQQVYVKPRPAKIAPHHPKKEKLTTSQAKFVSEKLKTSSESVPFVSHPEILHTNFLDSVVEEEPEVEFDIRQAVIYSEILKRPSW